MNLRVGLLRLFSILLFLPLLSAQDRVIPYRISGTLWHQGLGREIPTPRELVQKIERVFDLWASVSEAGLRFRNEGWIDRTIRDTADLPQDGRIYLMVNGLDEGGSGVSGTGGHFGTLPDNYRGAHVIINTRRGLYTLRLKTLIHEIGHALGLGHSASPASVMTCGTPAWSDYEFLTLSEQDRLELARIWNPRGTRFYSLQGKILSSENLKFYDVLAVDIKQGHCYSAQTNARGEFTLTIGKEGSYKLLAKGLESAAFDKPVPVLPTWYTGTARDTNLPGSAAELVLNAGHRTYSGLQIRMIESKTPFPLYWAQSANATRFNPAFLPVGGKGAFVLLYSRGHIKRVEAFGEQPDVRLSLSGRTDGGGNPWVEIEALENAIEGERLILAYGEGPEIEAGLVGIHVREHALPSFIPGGLQDQNGEVDSQLRGAFDFQTLRPGFWKQP